MTVKMRGIYQQEAETHEGMQSCPMSQILSSTIPLEVFLSVCPDIFVLKVTKL